MSKTIEKKEPPKKTVKVAPDVHKELKKKAADEGKPLEVVIDETLKKGME